MNPEAKTILLLIEQYLNNNPQCRFTQALFNLTINEFVKPYKDYPNNLRDIYNDSDKTILNRILTKIEPNKETTII